MDAIERAVGSDGAIPGFTAEETIEILTGLVTGPDEEREVLIGRLFDDITMGTAVRRAMQMGILVERIRGINAAAHNEDAASPLPIPGHPDLGELIGAIDTRLPNIRTIHAYTQATLLQAIQRLAVDASVEELASLADAYLTLPGPSEDDLDTD